MPGLARAGQNMDLSLYSFTAHVMSSHVKNGRMGMKQFRAPNFENFGWGRGGGNFYLGRGCLVKDISIRSAVLLGEWVRKEASGRVIYRMCVGGIPTVEVSLCAD